MISFDFPVSPQGREYDHINNDTKPFENAKTSHKKLSQIVFFVLVFVEKCLYLSRNNFNPYLALVLL